VADPTQLLSRFSFVRYKHHLMDEHFAIATINKKINSLKVYNDFLVLKGWVHESCIQLRKDQVKIAAGSEQIVEALTDGQVDTLLHFLEHQSKVSVRNKTICYLLLYGGLRISELVNIKKREIDFMTSSLLVMGGKGGKVREISLRRDVIQLIQCYVKGDRANSDYVESDYLFLSQPSPKIHHDAVRNWLSIISKDVGFKLYPHLFRHTFCTRLLRKGVDLTTVSKLAGHSTVNMTAKFYIQTTRQDKQNAVDRL
jgi:integrase/recombinase XerD